MDQTCSLSSLHEADFIRSINQNLEFMMRTVAPMSHFFKKVSRSKYYLPLIQLFFVFFKEKSWSFSNSLTKLQMSYRETWKMWISMKSKLTWGKLRNFFQKVRHRCNGSHHKLQILINRSREINFMKAGQRTGLIQWRLMSKNRRNFDNIQFLNDLQLK